MAFQTVTQDRFTAVIEELPRRRVVASRSSNQTTPGCACELFLLEPGPVRNASPAEL